MRPARCTRAQDFAFADDIYELPRDIFIGMGNVSRFVELCGGVLRVRENNVGREVQKAFRGLRKSSSLVKESNYLIYSYCSYINDSSRNVMKIKGI